MEGLHVVGGLLIKIQVPILCQFYMMCLTTCLKFIKIVCVYCMYVFIVTFA
jgi:hypothetical protein